MTFDESVVLHRVGPLVRRCSTNTYMARPELLRQRWEEPGAGRVGTRHVQEYLAHKKLPPPRTLQ